MGGMFSVVKIREGLGRNDYRDPGPYKNPAGTVAYEFEGSMPDAPSHRGEAAPEPADIEVTVVKPRMKPHNVGQH
jgi:hypothetical protein